MDFRESQSMDSITTAEDGASSVMASDSVQPKRFTLTLDPARDSRLTEFGKETLKDRYLLPGESYQDLFARVACAYADDAEHAQRLYDYISKLWFMPATPVLSNGGTGRGLPISCYLNSVDDSLEGIVNTWNENVWLASGRRHRHLLGQRTRHWRAGGPEWQDQRYHPLRARDGFSSRSPFRKARCGAGLPPAISTSTIRRLRNSSKSANPRAISTARRSTCTTACC
jgi:hypothetical protein